MDTLSLRPPYIPIMQKPSCCAPAVLQMILYRNGYGLFDQEKVATELGVAIVEGFESAFAKPMRTVEFGSADEGIRTKESAERVNAFFKNHAVSLCAKSVPSSALPSLEIFLTQSLLRNNDIWVEYHNNETRDPINRNPPSIHDGLIESLNRTTKEVTLINPSPARQQRMVVSLPTLSRALSSAFGRETGFLVVSRGIKERSPRP